MGTAQIEVCRDLSGMSVLEALSLMLVNESKTTLRRLIAEGKVELTGERVPLSAVVKTGDTIEVPDCLNFNPPPAKSLDLDVLHEDTMHLVLNKPSGVPVLPDRNGKCRGFYDSLVAYVNRKTSKNGPYVRPHIVHRLDKQTSGVILVAKNTAASRDLSLQFQNREVKKVYLAVVEGVFPRDEYIVDVPLRASDKSPIAMVPDEKKGKEALTRISVMRRFDHFTALRLEPKTGRQHQLRVHLAALGYPLAVDFLYGRREQLTGRMLPEVTAKDVFDADHVFLDRLPLHAREITYSRPVDTGECHTVKAPIPPDIKGFLETLDDTDSGA